MSNTISKPTEISEIAYAFIGSQALFAALDLGVFEALAPEPLALADLARGIDATEQRAQYLATALVSLGLLEIRDHRYSNPPVVTQFLLRASPHFFGDYLRDQINRQMYPAMAHIGNVVRGQLDDVPFTSYSAWMEDPAEAHLFTDSQHVGSTGPASLLAKRVDLSGCRRLIDIGGGSGAFTIALCAKYPSLSVDLIDFPNVLERTRQFLAAASLTDRVRLVPADATANTNAPWTSEPAEAVLMSYLLSGVAHDSMLNLFRRAAASLAPGGVLLIHDFLLDDDRTGPRLTALWALQHLAFTPDGASLTTASLSVLLAEAGLALRTVEPLIPGLTKLVTAEHS